MEPKAFKYLLQKQEDMEKAELASSLLGSASKDGEGNFFFREIGLFIPVFYQNFVKFQSLHRQQKAKKKPKMPKLVLKRKNSNRL